LSVIDENRGSRLTEARGVRLASNLDRLVVEIKRVEGGEKRGKVRNRFLNNLPLSASRPVTWGGGLEVGAALLYSRAVRGRAEKGAGKGEDSMSRKNRGEV